ncbi:toll-like receptor e [Plakobranchus ocellatus]|uniref:Toll-like receptor e n=1 Tax=Plakobranchus ocellatus TaxID=259542 RepID=A0AAV4BRL1_9GAST|nr:toll-like receptor e [Plakobranchus ocellatus]
MDGESAVVNVPVGDSTIVGVPHGGSVVVTLNLGSVRTRGRPKGQDRINRFAKKRKLATNSVVGESAVVDSCVLCDLCGDIELAREFCVNGMIKRVYNKTVFPKSDSLRLRVASLVTRVSTKYQERQNEQAVFKSQKR